MHRRDTLADLDPRNHQRDREDSEDEPVHQRPQPMVDAPDRLEPSSRVRIEDEAQHDDARSLDDVMEVHGEPGDDRVKNVHVFLSARVE